mgnify:CR=1 FL=1
MGNAVVIIGSGLAGYAVARELRKLDSSIPITMISADHGGFYSKPMLSNALSTGKTPESILNGDAVQMAAQLKIAIRPHCRVDAINKAQNTLTLEDGVQEKEFPSEAVKVKSSLGHASISVSLFIVT